MASPQKPVFSLAVINPKWVRAYVAEADLGKLRMGMPASIAIDSFPGQRFKGWVGFVSPVAEFTPKNVETEELRTSLVYEVQGFRQGSDRRSSSRIARHCVSSNQRCTADSSAKRQSLRDRESSAMSGRDVISTALIGSRIHKTFHRDNGEDVIALDDVSFEVRARWR